ncbi:MAG: HEAT repeat domain-containing protein [Candidatus Thorarchaeota archaeon]
MSLDKDRKSILKAVKERVKQSEELQLTQMIVDAIGERRDRDLGDLLSQIEQDRGWLTTVKHLSHARELPYTLPIGAGPQKTLIEDLKFRETIFAILDCNGFEPIKVTIDDIFSRLENEESLIDASRSFRIECESMATKQIESGDTLFFDLTRANRSLSGNMVELLEKTQRAEVTTLCLDKHKDLINIQPLWYCEMGRQALSQLGIKGTEVDTETFDIVISVIQQEIPVAKSTDMSTSDMIPTRPSNPLYRKLLNSTINQEIDNLSALSSIHSYSTLKSMLENSLDHYTASQSSSTFREILICINAHVRVRTPESVIHLDNIAQSKDNRISTAAITALGNFYNEGAASALVDLLCNARDKEVANTTIRAIKNVSKRCFETKYIVKKTTESSSCTNVGNLKRLYKEIWKEKDEYYL